MDYIEGSGFSISSSYHSSSFPSEVIVDAVFIFYLNLLCYYNIESLLNLYSNFFPVDRICEITEERYVTAGINCFCFEFSDNIDQVLPQVNIVFLIGLYIDTQKFNWRY